MAQENYVEGCSMQIPPLLETERFCFWKTRFVTYIKCKDIDLWQVIQNSDFYFKMEDSKTKMMKEMSYEVQKDDQKKQLGKNNEAKMTLYNTLPPKVTDIEEAKDLATLPIDELIDNLKFYEMILENDGIASKTTKEKVKSLALKAKVTREQISDDNNSQGGSDEDIDEEVAEAFSLMARNFPLGTKEVKALEKGEVVTIAGKKATSLVSVQSPRRTRPLLEELGLIVKTVTNLTTCLMAIDSQKVQTKPSTSNNDLDIIEFQKENEELLSKKSKLLSKINDLELEVKKLVNDKDVVEPCKKCDVLTQEVDSLKCNVTKLQNESLNFSKFKKSNIFLNDMLSRQKLSQDKEGLVFSTNEKTTSVCLKCDLLPNDWIMDSGCTKHMIRSRRLFTSYKAYNGEHVVFGSNQKVKVIGGGNVSHDSVTITNVEHVSGLAFNLISVG
ncbi:hypothetical protein Tco_1227556 [Tanacetum coccineum]